MTHNSMCKLFTSIIQITFYAALVNTKLRSMWKWVFNTITIPTLKNPELHLSGIRQFLTVHGILYCWCACLQAIQVSLCTIKEALREKSGNCEKSSTTESMNSHGQWGLWMWLGTTFEHQYLRSFTHMCEVDWTHTLSMLSHTSSCY